MGKSRKRLQSSSSAASPAKAARSAASAGAAKATAIAKPIRAKAKGKAAAQGRKSEFLQRLQAAAGAGEQDAQRVVASIGDLGLMLPSLEAGGKGKGGKAGKGRKAPMKNKARNSLFHTEVAQFGQVLQHPSFAANPMLAIRLHLQNTIPQLAEPAAEEAAPAERPKMGMGARSKALGGAAARAAESRQISASAGRNFTSSRAKVGGGGGTKKERRGKGEKYKSHNEARREAGVGQVRGRKGAQGARGRVQQTGKHASAPRGKGSAPRL